MGAITAHGPSGRDFFVGDDWFWLSGSTGRDYDPSSGKEAHPTGIGLQAEAIWSNALGQVMNDAIGGRVPRSQGVRLYSSGGRGRIRRHSTETARDFGSGAGAALTGLVISRLLHREAMLGNRRSLLP